MPDLSSPHYHALIMAGGKGERFWPWSRLARPKQLLPLFGKKTMIEMTVDRLMPLIPRERIWIVTNATQARAMGKLMPRFPKRNFIVEPVGRDSGGAVMLGCATVAARDPDAVMALLPADHIIKDTRGYLRNLKDCFAAAAKDSIMVTLGINPAEPSSAYGYVERGAANQKAPGGTRIFKVRRFLEKPDFKTAQKFVRSGRHYWNAGMFIWSASTIHEALCAHSPIHAKGWKALQSNRRAYMARGWRELPKISIDYAVMEKAKNICVAEGRFDWDDVGSWSALAAHLSHDKHGNSGQGHRITVDSQNNLVLGNSKTIAILGVRDLVVVQTPDATLICHRNATQRVKEIVKQLPESLL